MTNATYNAIWLAAQNAMTYTLNDNRRKSWTAIEDLTDCTKNSHKSSVSLTSLDSEEQESLRTNERLHNRTNRNSTGGISTHSLNEAELAVNINFKTNDVVKGDWTRFIYFCITLLKCKLERKIFKSKSV